MNVAAKDHTLYQKPQIDGNPLLNICWKMAGAAHGPDLPPPGKTSRWSLRTSAKPAAETPRSKSHLRDKANGTELPYLTHPQMTLRILAAAGETDTLPLAAALLHDTVENFYIPEVRKGMGNKPEGEAGERWEQHCRKDAFTAFEQDLVTFVTPYYRDLHPRNERLQKQDVKNFVSAVVSLMHEVTNETLRPEGKMFTQATRAHRISPRARRLKMADHAASMICDLLIEPSDQGKMWPFAQKAFAVADASREASPQLHRLIDTLYDEVYEVSSKAEPKEREALREAFRAKFDLLQAMRDSKAFADERALHPEAEPTLAWAESRDAAAASNGIVGVALEDGRVTGYRMLANPTESEADPSNRAITAMLRNVQSDGNHAEFGDPELTREGRVVRRFMVTRRPIPLGTFLKMAHGAQAIEDGFAQQLSAPPAPGVVILDPSSAARVGAEPEPVRLGVA